MLHIPFSFSFEDTATERSRSSSSESMPLVESRWVYVVFCLCIIVFLVISIFIYFGYKYRINFIFLRSTVVAKFNNYQRTGQVGNVPSCRLLAYFHLVAVPRGTTMWRKKVFNYCTLLYRSGLKYVSILHCCCLCKGPFLVFIYVTLRVKRIVAACANALFLCSPVLLFE